MPRRDPVAPLVTFYDCGTGERIELSGITFDNWLSKTANLLRDDFDVEPGQEVALDLPTHWIVPVWTAAIWALGARISFNGGEAADVLVSGPRIPQPNSRQQIAACSLAPMAMGYKEKLPLGVVDFFSEVRMHGDQFGPRLAITDETVALSADAKQLTRGDIEITARELAHDWNLGSSGRLLVDDQSLDSLSSWWAMYSVPLAVDGSVVIVRNADQGDLDNIKAQERATAIAAPVK